MAVTLKNDSNLVWFGADSSVAGNQNQWFIAEAGNGTVEIPFTASDIKTAATPKAGSVEAIATFTMSYQ